MAFFDEISKKVNDVTQAAVKKSKDIYEIQKIGTNIKLEEEKMDKIYIHIGKLVYTKYCSGGKFEETVSKLCEQARESDKKIQSYREKVAEVKDIKHCTICGREIEKSVTTCPVCGLKLDISLMKVDDK